MTIAMPERTRTSKQTDAVLPMVSVVVPTYRRPQLLARCLEALRAQTLAPERYEILVADDGPDDDVRHVVKRFSRIADAPAIHYLAIRRTQGPAAARNAAWQRACAPLIAFTDDDTVPDPDWLAAGCAAMSSVPHAAAAAGWIEVPLDARPTDYERDASGLAHAEFATANCFVRRAALVRVQGFDERFTRAWREDADLMFRLRQCAGPIIRAPRARVLHPVRPAYWGVSVSQQAKVMFDVLLYKKAPRLYRRHIRRTPPWLYYAACGALLGSIAAALAGDWWLAGTCLAVWLGLTARFSWQRLRQTSHAPAHVAEMIVTSMLIPPVSLYWRLRGAWRFRTLFL